MTRKTTKKRASAAGSKRKATAIQAAPRTAEAISSPGTPPSPGLSVPVIAPPAPTVAQKLQTRKQTWTDLPENSKIREKAAAIVAMKIQGYDNDEIAHKLSLSVRSLRQYMWIAGKNGWLRTDDPRDVAEFDIAHQVVDGLRTLVNHRNALGLPDKEVILKSAEGLGIFKDSKQPVEQAALSNNLTINVVMPGGERPEVRPGTTLGVGAYVEGDVVNGNAPDSGRPLLPTSAISEV